MDQRKKWTATIKKSATYFIILIGIVISLLYVLGTW